MMDERKNAVTFIVQRKNGTFTEQSKELFREQIAQLELTGDFKIQIKKSSGYVLKSRYKYYFDSLLNSIFEYGKTRYLVQDGITQRQPKSTQELHECIKLEFNSVYVINAKTGEVGKTANSTTNLSDKDFIGRFLEEIQMVFMQDYPDIEIEGYEDWKLRMKEKYD